MNLHTIIEQCLPKEKKLRIRGDIRGQIKDVTSIAHNQAVSKMRKSIPTIVELMIAAL